MKKKEIIARMTMQKSDNTPFLKKYHIIPAIVCILIAIAIWLFAVNMTNRDMPDLFSVDNEVATEEVSP